MFKGVSGRIPESRGSAFSDEDDGDGGGGGSGDDKYGGRLVKRVAKSKSKPQSNPSPDPSREMGMLTTGAKRAALPAGLGSAASGLASAASVTTAATSTIISSVTLAILVVVTTITLTVSSVAYVNSNAPIDHTSAFAPLRDFPLHSVIRKAGNATNPTITGSASTVLTDNGTLVTQTGYFDRVFINGSQITNVNGSVGLGGNVMGPAQSVNQTVSRWVSADGTTLSDSRMTVNDDGDVSGVRELSVTGNVWVNGEARGNVFSGISSSPSNVGTW